MGKPAKPRAPDRRGQWTLKHAGFDVEFKALVKEAARRAGMGQSEWVMVTLREAAQRAVKGEPAPAKHPPPAPAPDISGEIEALRKAVEGLRERLDEPPRRRWWKRMFP